MFVRMQDRLAGISGFPGHEYRIPPFLPASPKVGFVQVSFARWHGGLENRSVARHEAGSLLLSVTALLDVRGVDKPQAVGIGVGSNTCGSSRILEEPIAENRVVIRGLENMCGTVIPPPISRRQKWNFLVPFPEEVP
ncbi:hypothetical protein XAC2911_470080 [Xanthomonas citri pv. citri]|nr:hypothetical protein XAC2911_470080 [Xanthomonas citri pv. citri]